MSSMLGARPEGTDGSDHWHRESIAWQYRLSSINKSRLKFDIFLQMLLGFLMFMRLLPALSALFGFSFQSLRRWDLPAPRPWEYAWIISISAAVLGWRSTSYNKSFLLKQYMLGTVVFGLFPVLFGFIDVSNDLYVYITERKYTYVMFSFPAILLWSTFLFIAAQLHVFGLYFSSVLLKAWKPRGKKVQ
ncbi:hypothetical protein LOTGIDRAFT_216100 [Lottia gigantea]|uniref:Protein jagunal n=1 Tax=Lottia gigantea TaxID=225164 RepID=V4ADS3_LOTGI|nr:hypothetical protein LOTGIDRAFT_216100 [Lottia gigantea]ESO93275.1 hypothetical protein LOTGIDRAFT_216100 [Lottia gigantea]